MGVTSLDAGNSTEKSIAWVITKLEVLSKIRSTIRETEYTGKDCPRAYLISIKQCVELESTRVRSSGRS